MILCNVIYIVRLICTNRLFLSALSTIFLFRRHVFSSEVTEDTTEDNTLKCVQEQLRPSVNPTRYISSGVAENNTGDNTL
jgi:hypothetical protein